MLAFAFGTPITCVVSDFCSFGGLNADSSGAGGGGGLSSSDDGSGSGRGSGSESKSTGDRDRVRGADWTTGTGDGDFTGGGVGVFSAGGGVGDFGGGVGLLGDGGDSDFCATTVLRASRDGFWGGSSSEESELFVISKNVILWRGEQETYLFLVDWQAQFFVLPQKQTSLWMGPE
jgi:hypothetical protein